MGAFSFLQTFFVNIASAAGWSTFCLNGILPGVARFHFSDFWKFSVSDQKIRQFRNSFVDFDDQMIRLFSSSWALRATLPCIVSSGVLGTAGREPRDGFPDLAGTAGRLPRDRKFSAGSHVYDTFQERKDDLARRRRRWIKNTFAKLISHWIWWFQRMKKVSRSMFPRYWFLGNRGTGFPSFREPRDVPPCPAVKPRDEDTMVVQPTIRK